MSNYINIPISQDGIVVDTNIAGLIRAAMSPEFGFSDVYCYSHGWSLDATRMMDWYNQFSIEYNLSTIALAQRQLFTQPPAPHTLGIGIHWPSMVSEDQDNPLNYLQQLTFFTMDKRAGTVGQHGVYAVLRLLLSDPNLAKYPGIRINLIGHSFGCKVIVSALEQIYQDMQKNKIPPVANASFNVVLLQGAFERKLLDAGECFGDVEKLNIRMLVTRSTGDAALQVWFDRAHANINFFFKKSDPNERALGADGPTQETIAAMNSAGPEIPVDEGFDGSAIANDARRLITADLSPIHAARGDTGNAIGGGHHSDIFLPEVYALIAAFLYNNNTKPKSAPIAPPPP